VWFFLLYKRTSTKVVPHRALFPPFPPAKKKFLRIIFAMKPKIYWTSKTGNMYTTIIQFHATDIRYLEIRPPLNL